MNIIHCIFIDCPWLYVVGTTPCQKKILSVVNPHFSDATPKNKKNRSKYYEH